MAALWVAWVAVVVFAVVAVALTPRLAAEKVLRSLERKRVLIFTIDGGVFDGLLVAYDRRSWTLVDVHARSQAVPVPAAAGEFYIDRGRIAYWQRLATDGAMTVVPDGASPAGPVATPAAA